jgi:hypothetical protein
MNRASIGALCTVAAVAIPSFASAQAAPSSFNYFVPPKLIKKGTFKTPIGGTGTVVVKVLVNKDGTSKVQGVIHSTNPEDDKAALEIAATSTYKPAMRGSVKETAFYDFTLKFAGGSASADEGDTPQLEQYRRMITAGNYSGAKADLTTYVAQHPEDATAHLYLGLAEANLSQAHDAVAQFDKAGNIPAELHPIVAKAYADAAVDAISAKDSAAGLALAKRAVELAPTYDKYSVLGYANLAVPDLPGAIGAFEKARDLAKSENASAKQQAMTETYLVSAYAQNGDFAKAKEAASAAKQLDPATNADSVLENYYLKHGNDLSQAGKTADAAAVFEQAAAALPKSAAAFYSQAAFAYLRAKPDPANAGKPDPNVAKADADADKALAADPNNALANFAKGVALANGDKSKSKDAMDYLKKADEQSKKGADPGLTTAIENVIKQMNGGK